MLGFPPSARVLILNCDDFGMYRAGRRVPSTDHEFLTSPDAREALHREQIVVIDYRTIRDVWARTNASPPTPSPW